VNGEVDTFGVFLPAALVTAVSAFVALFVLRRGLRAVNAYAFVWHAGLFDVALYVVLWWLIAWAAHGLR
jgi:Protein of unknown function (DUF1656)